MGASWGLPGLTRASWGLPWNIVIVLLESYQHYLLVQKWKLV